MSREQLLSSLLALGLLIVSGLADSRGFIHASRMWVDDELVLSELGYTALSFGIGIGIYCFTLRLLIQIGIVAPEIQTLVWFSVTIIGVSLVSGSFLKWALTEQIVAGIVAMGVCWLLISTEG